MDNSKLILGNDSIKNKIYTIRGVQVMIDQDLALLYGVSTKRLNEQVRRNKNRFPSQFCFKLSRSEYNNLKSQFATSSLISQFVISNKHGGIRKLPHVFTEQGVAMLSGVLKSKIAIHISIQIMSEFIAMRKVIQTNSLIYSRLDNIEQKQITADKKFDQIFDALSNPNTIPKQKIFFENQTFDAHKFVSDIIRSAKKEIILIDNYVDDTVLSLFTKQQIQAKTTVLCKHISTELLNSLEKYNSQYPPIIIKQFSLSHDRFLIIDQHTIYHFGASLKDLGKKWFAVSRFTNEILFFLNKIEK